MVNVPVASSGSAATGVIEIDSDCVVVTVASPPDNGRLLFPRA